MSKQQMIKSHIMPGERCIAGISYPSVADATAAICATVSAAKEQCQKKRRSYPGIYAQHGLPFPRRRLTEGFLRRRADPGPRAQRFPGAALDKPAP